MNQNWIVNYLLRKHNLNVRLSASQNSTVHGSTHHGSALATNGCIGPSGSQAIPKQNTNTSQHIM